MIEKCTGRIIDWLIRYNAVKEADRELYEYALYSALLTISPMFLAICFGILFGAVWRSVLIIMPFFTIRKFSGGYHAKNAGICLISSSLLLVLCIVLSFSIKCNWIFWVITMLAVVSLACFSPLENENKLLSREELCHYKKITVVIAASFVMVELVLFWFHMNTCVVCITIGLVLSASLQFPCIIKSSVAKNDQK